MQIAVGLLYGFFANIPAVDGTSSNQFTGSIVPVFLAFGMLFLVVVGNC